VAKRIFDALVDLFGNHPVYIILGMGVLYSILELIEGRSFMKGLVSNSLYSFAKSAFFTVMLLSLIGAFAYQAIFVEIDRFEKAAEALDLTYHLKDHPTANVLFCSPLLRRGERPDIVSPILSGPYKGIPVVLFNLRYGRTESAGESHSFYYRSVVAFSVQGQRVPAFSLVPAREAVALFERIPGEKAVPFEEDEAFSRRYVLKGPEPDALKRVFGPDLRRALVQSPELWTAGVVGEHLVLFRDGKTDDRIEGDAFAAYIEETYALYRTLMDP